MEELFERFRGQPVQVMTCDGVRYCGIVVVTCRNSIEIVDKCDRVAFVPLKRINAIVEPMMEEFSFCDETDCDCRAEDRECGCEDDGDYQEPVPLKKRWDDDDY